MLAICKKAESTLLLPNFVFVKHDKIMSKMVELELVKRWHHFFAVVPLVEHTEGEHENWIVGVQRLHAVVTAFVNIHDKVAVFAGCRFFAGICVYADIRFVLEQRELLKRRFRTHCSSCVVRRAPSLMRLSSAVCRLRVVGDGRRNTCDGLCPICYSCAIMLSTGGARNGT